MHTRNSIKINKVNIFFLYNRKRTKFENMKAKLSLHFQLIRPMIFTEILHRYQLPSSGISSSRKRKENQPRRHRARQPGQRTEGKRRIENYNIIQLHPTKAYITKIPTTTTFSFGIRLPTTQNTPELRAATSILSSGAI